jgi:hypothetical protein
MYEAGLSEKAGQKQPSWEKRGVFCRGFSYLDVCFNVVLLSALCIPEKVFLALPRFGRVRMPLIVYLIIGSVGAILRLECLLWGWGFEVFGRVEA